MAEKKYQLARKAFDEDYARILHLAKADRELSQYQRIMTTISLNKFVSLGLLPLAVIGDRAVEFKYPGKFAQNRKQGLIGIFCLAMLTNSLALYQS